MDMSIPTEASVKPKSLRMSVNRPIGMNSDVLNINAANVNDNNDNTLLNVMRWVIFFFFKKFSLVLW